MKYSSLNRDEMKQDELNSICEELKNAIQIGSEQIEVDMAIGVTRIMVDLDGHLDYYDEKQEVFRLMRRGIKAKRIKAGSES